MTDRSADQPGSRSRETYLPVAINMRGLRCLIVGGGRIASRKASALVKANATLTVVAPQIAPALVDLAHRGVIRMIEGEYEPHLMGDYDFIIAATSDGDLNLAIGRQAQSEGKLCCVVSSVRDSQVIFPATFEHEGLTYAVHSNGLAYRRTKEVRDRLEQFIKGDQSQLE